MVKEVTSSDMCSCKMFDTSTVATSTTIPAQGNPLLVNISVHDHGELSSREPCRLLRPLNEQSVAMTRVSSQVDTASMHHPSGTTASVSLLGQPSLAHHLAPSTNAPPESQPMRMELRMTCNTGPVQAGPSFLVSDELNTPEIVGLDYEFKFGANSSLNSSTCDVAIDTPLWDDMPPVPFNPSHDAPMSDMHFDWSLMNQAPSKRPSELRLQLHCGSLTNPSLDTPSMVVDTHDVMHQLEGNQTFDLVSYIEGNKAKLPVLDSPQVSTKTAMVKRQQIFVEEDPCDDVPYLNPVVKSAQDIPYLNPVVKSAEDIPFLNPVVKCEGKSIVQPQVFVKEEHVEFVAPPLISPIVPSPFNVNSPTNVNSTGNAYNVNIDACNVNSPTNVNSNNNACNVNSNIINIPSPTNVDTNIFNNPSPSNVNSNACNVTSSTNVNSPDVSLKRSKRIQSRGSCSSKRQSSDSEDSDDESVSSKKPRYSGKRAIKLERDEDNSSIASSAAEWKYHDHRVRNNEASRRSRQNRKSKETEMEQRAAELSSENKRLHSKVDSLQHLVLTLRRALLDSMGKAKNK